MTKEQIEKIVEIMSHADGGCVYCASNLIEELVKEFNLDKKLVLTIIRKVQKDHYWSTEEDLKDDFRYLFED